MLENLKRMQVADFGQNMYTILSFF